VNADDVPQSEEDQQLKEQLEMLVERLKVLSINYRWFIGS
jgi:hypothetical protein